MLDLIKKHSNRGLIVDTNILLLFFIGTFDERQISTFRRTRQFTVDDFYLLASFLDRFETIFVTPNILTEVSNLSPEPNSLYWQNYFLLFSDHIQLLPEFYVPSKDTAASETFQRLGLTDAGIVELAKRDGYLVLTDDAKLANFLYEHDVDVINFTHLRDFEV
jgi:hypothetical protein